jgi:SAM-dependent methyltransferase
MYSFKDYAEEGEFLRHTIEQYRPHAKTLLDVACGTGMHLAGFSKWLECEGLDLDPKLLEIARRRLESVRLHLGDMRDFELGKSFDVVTCLFSSIGYATTIGEVGSAFRAFHRHLNPGGLLLVEPWLYQENFKSPHLHLLTVDRDDQKIARVSRSSSVGDVSVLDFEYLIVGFDRTERLTEHHELGLYTQAEYEAAMAAAGFQVEYDPIGPMGRGMFIGIRT